MKDVIRRPTIFHDDFSWSRTWNTTAFTYASSCCPSPISSTASSSECKCRQSTVATSSFSNGPSTATISHESSSTFSFTDGSTYAAAPTTTSISTATPTTAAVATTTTTTTLSTPNVLWRSFHGSSTSAHAAAYSTTPWRDSTTPLHGRRRLPSGFTPSAPTTTKLCSAARWTNATTTSAAARSTALPPRQYQRFTESHYNYGRSGTAGRSSLFCSFGHASKARRYGSNEPQPWPSNGSQQVITFFSFTQMFSTSFVFGLGKMYHRHMDHQIRQI